MPLMHKARKNVKNNAVEERVMFNVEKMNESTIEEIIKDHASNEEGSNA